MTTLINERRYTTFDKSDWGDGPWTDEPDKVQWKDAATGLPCLAVRNHWGSWCGYVGVSPGHPLYEKDYSDLDNFDVHGGITYADHCAHGPEDSSICHIPDPGEPDNVYWFGFDCGHFMDLIPGMAAHYRKLHKETGDPLWDTASDRGTYKTLSYVQEEVTRLAAQLDSREI